MKTTILGRTGMRVSRICLGCMSYGTPEWRPWVLNEDQARPVCERAIEVTLRDKPGSTRQETDSSHLVRGMGRAAPYRPARRNG